MKRGGDGECKEHKGKVKQPRWGMGEGGEGVRKREKELGGQLGDSQS